MPHGEQPVDKASFREIYQATRALEEQCVAPTGHPGKVGWTVVGECFFCILMQAHSYLCFEMNTDRGLVACCRTEDESWYFFVGDGFEYEF